MSTTWPSSMPDLDTAYTYSISQPMSASKFTASNTRRQLITTGSVPVFGVLLKCNNIQYETFRTWWKNDLKHGEQIISDFPVSSGVGTNMPTSVLILGQYSSQRIAENEVQVNFSVRPEEESYISFSDYTPVADPSGLRIPLNDKYGTHVRDIDGNIVGEFIDGYASTLFPGSVTPTNQGGYLSNIRGFARWQSEMTGPSGLEYIECNFEHRPWVMPAPEGNGVRVQDSELLRSIGEFKISGWVQHQYTKNQFDILYDPLIDQSVKSKIDSPNAVMFMRGYQLDMNFSLSIETDVTRNNPTRFVANVKGKTSSGTKIETSITADLVPEAYIRPDPVTVIDEFSNDSGEIPTLGAYTWGGDGTGFGDEYFMRHNGSLNNYWTGRTRVELPSSITSGKYYIAYKINHVIYDAGSFVEFGAYVEDHTPVQDFNTSPGRFGYAYRNTGESHFNNNHNYNPTGPYGPSWNDTDEIGLGLDFDTGEMRFYKNGIAQPVVPDVDIRDKGIIFTIGGRGNGSNPLPEEFKLRNDPTLQVFQAPAGYIPIPNLSGPVEDRTAIGYGVWNSVALEFTPEIGGTPGALRLFWDDEEIASAPTQISEIILSTVANDVCIGTVQHKWEGDFNTEIPPKAVTDNKVEISSLSYRASFSDFTINDPYIPPVIEEITLATYGWKKNPDNGYWYRVTAFKMPRDSHAGVADSLGGEAELATIDSPSLNAWLIANLGVSSGQHYIGWLTGNTNWDDGTIKAYDNWHSGQPNGATGEAVVINGTDGTWYDTQPTDTEFAIVQIKDQDALSIYAWQTVKLLHWGWIQEPSTGHWYKVADVGDTPTWDVANEYSKALGARLARPLNSTVNDWLLDTWLDFRGSGYWVGVRNFGTGASPVWKYEDGSTISYLPWGAGEPSGDAVTPGYGIYTLESDAGLWQDASTDGTHLGMMEIRFPSSLSADNWRDLELEGLGWRKSPNTGHWYKLTDTQQGWNAGEAIAIERGAHLASIHNSAENSWIFDEHESATAVNGWMWVGGHIIVNANNAQWSDGTQWDYTSWANGQPNNAAPNQNFLEFNFLLPGWADTQDLYDSWGLMQIKYPTLLTEDEWYVIRGGEADIATGTLAGVSHANELYAHQGDVYFYGENIGQRPYPSTYGAWWQLDGTFRDVNDNYASVVDYSQREGLSPAVLPVYSKRPACGASTPEESGATRHMTIAPEQAVVGYRQSDLDGNGNRIGEAAFDIMALVGPEFDKPFSISFQYNLSELPPQEMRWLWFAGDTKYRIGILVDNTGAMTYIKSDAYIVEGNTNSILSSKYIGAIQVGVWTSISIIDNADGNGDIIINGILIQYTDLPQRAQYAPTGSRSLYYSSKSYDVDGTPRHMWGGGIQDVAPEALRGWDLSRIHSEWSQLNNRAIYAPSGSGDGLGFGNTTANPADLLKNKIAFGHMWEVQGLGGVMAIGLNNNNTDSTNEMCGTTHGLGVWSDGNVLEAGSVIETSYATWHSNDTVTLVINKSTGSVSIRVNDTDYPPIPGYTIHPTNTLYPMASMSGQEAILWTIYELEDFPSIYRPRMPLESYVWDIPDAAGIENLFRSMPGALRRIYMASKAVDTSVIESATNASSPRIEFRKVGDSIWVDKSCLVQWVTNNYLRSQIGDLSAGFWECRVVTAEDIPTNIIGIEILDVVVTPGIQDSDVSFDFTTIDINTLGLNWDALHRQWGGVNSVQNSGVNRELIGINNIDGLQLELHGDYYSGGIHGCDKQRNPWYMKERKSGVIASKKYFGPGVFTIVAKFPPRMGATYPFWLFHYEEIYPEDTRWDSSATDGFADVAVQGNGFDGYYKVRNHEIDFPEVPTVLKTNPDSQEANMDNLRFNSWRGELEGEFIDVFENMGLHLCDGEYHTVRLEWQTDQSPNLARLFIDGVYSHTIQNDDYVPYIPMKMTLGGWFPSAFENLWGGPVAAFDRAQFHIKSFDYVAASQVGSTPIPETYPYAGYAEFGDGVLPAIPFTPASIYHCLADFRATAKFNIPITGTVSDDQNFPITNSRTKVIYDLAQGHNLWAGGSAKESNIYISHPTGLSSGNGAVSLREFKFERLDNSALLDPIHNTYLEVFLVAKWDNSASHKRILGNGLGGSVPNTVQMTVLNNGTRVSWGTSNHWNSADGIAPNKWHILHMVIDGANSYLNVDGVRVSSGNISGLLLQEWIISGTSGSIGECYFSSMQAFTKPLTSDESSAMYRWIAYEYGVQSNGY